MIIDKVRSLITLRNGKLNYTGPARRSGVQQDTVMADEASDFGSLIRGWDASCCVIIIGKEVKPSIPTVCVCSLLLHVEYYNMFRPIWAIIR
jgi:hypothetical protein